MLEIKFRAWDKIGKFWIDSVLYSTDWKKFCYTENNFHWRDVKDYEIVQYTGLKDKNGKEIYEGDILKWGNTVSFVVWDLDGWRFNSYMELGTFNLYSYVDVTSNKEIAEIIGNIYQNEDLLK